MAVILLVAVGAVWAVTGFVSTAVSARRAETALARVQAQAYLSDLFVHEVLVDGQVGAADYVNLHAARVSGLRALAMAQRLAGMGPMAGVSRVVAAENRQLRSVLHLVATGHVTAAILLDDRAGAADLANVTTAVRSTQARLSARATTAQRDAGAGVAATVVLAMVVALVVLALLARSRRRTLSLVVERTTVARSEARFRALVQDAADLITLVRPDGTITYQSTAVTPMLGHPADAFAGRPLRELVHPDEAARVLAGLEELSCQAGATARIECRLRRADGTWCDTETTAANRLGDAATAELVLTTRDVTERKALEEQLVHQAFHDSLTGLANRALLADRVAHALARSARSDAPVSLALIDLDDFKLVNDTYGHGVGDQLLRAVADRLRAAVRPADTVARLGGDEFAVLLEDTEAAAATAILERAVQTLADPVTLGAATVLVGASAGIAAAQPGVSGEELLRQADVALYAVKGSGKGSVTPFDPTLEHAAHVGRALVVDLSRAIATGQLVLFYQPVLTLSTRALVGVEALVRWNHPREGLLLPGAFIPAAERSGLIVPLGAWVLKQACLDAAGWARHDPRVPPRTIHVNVSAVQLATPQFRSTVAEALATSGLAPATLVLEITESELIGDLALAASQLRSLKELGVRIAIDDFGTGRSTLSYLARLPIDIIKIDKSFVDAMTTADEPAAVVRAVVDLSRSLNLATVAEGVERPDQAAMLLDLGCDEAQGFLYARPMPAAGLEVLMAAGEAPMPERAGAPAAVVPGAHPT
ncbi:MAG TPA: EAL domain-containing protein, partial [Candidatus Dormibacteraeota bacterium]|nr:EAL domain-containing protein [Candidatus Dormibacteraeota bacterium]